MMPRKMFRQGSQKGAHGAWGLSNQRCRTANWVNSEEDPLDRPAAEAGSCRAEREIRQWEQIAAGRRLSAERVASEHIEACATCHTVTSAIHGWAQRRERISRGVNNGGATGIENLRGAGRRDGRLGRPGVRLLGNLGA